MEIIIKIKTALVTINNFLNNFILILIKSSDLCSASLDKKKQYFSGKNILNYIILLFIRLGLRRKGFITANGTTAVYLSVEFFNLIIEKNFTLKHHFHSIFPDLHYIFSIHLFSSFIFKTIFKYIWSGKIVLCTSQSHL